MLAKLLEGKLERQLRQLPKVLKKCKMRKGNFNRRKLRTRAKIMGLVNRPRLSVYRSNRFISAQIIDDVKATTLVSVAEKEINEQEYLDKNNLAKARELGKKLAKKAVGLKIRKVVFDKGGYAYHGRIKAFAEGAREGGLEF